MPPVSPLSTFNSEPAQAATRIVRRLQGEGHTAYFAGGCVRDYLLGREAHDYDVATSARPEQVQALFPRNVAVGAQFGVIRVQDGGSETEVATFRSDDAYIDGRRPTGVTFATPEQDAARRDFTINGLFYDPVAEQLIDFVHGEADLAAGILRTIGDPAARFGEDRLRLLRAVRFSARLDLKIESRTWEAAGALAPTVTAVSAERIRDELVKIFLPPQRLRGFDLLDQSGLLRAVLPEMEALKGCEQPPEWHPEGDVFIHTRLMLSLLPDEVSVPLAFSILLHDIGKPATYSYDEKDRRIRFSGHEKAGAQITGEIMNRLRFSRAQTEATVAAVSRHMAFKDVQKMRVATLKRFMSAPNFEDEMQLHWADCSSSHRMLDNFQFLREKQAEFASEPLIPPPLVTGRDLIARGWTPGPRFGEVLETVQNRQLEGSLATREEALSFLSTLDLKS